MDINSQPISNYEQNYVVSREVSLEAERICQRNIEQTLRFFEHTFSAYEEIVAEDFWIHGPATGQETRGIEAAKRLDMGYADAYPDAEYKIHDLFAVRDRVVVRWSVKGTHLGERKGLSLSGGFVDLEPSKQGIVLNGIHVYRFNAEGKIAESWAMWDRLGEIEQIADISIKSKFAKGS
jgi:steroid delta-isomerase-like uncharacterized protein